MPRLNQYLTIKQAAEYLGVAPNTLRNWGRSGKLSEKRHPINNYRLYSQKELDALLGRVASARTRKPRRKPK